MNTPNAYATKAEKYARYRWDYAPEAIQAIWQAAQLTPTSVIADIGAGTGMLTKHFAGKVGQVFAIEPGAEMRREAAKRLPGAPACVILAASAEQTTLPDHSADLITAAQAIHWFDPLPTRQEFARILKPGGWLVLIHNSGEPSALHRAMDAVYTADNGVDPYRGAPPRNQKPVEFYFGQGTYQQMRFPFSFRQGWDAFIGALCSASYMPDESHPAFPRFEQSARAVFDRFCPDGWETVSGVTELAIGQPLFQCAETGEP